MSISDIRKISTMIQVASNDNFGIFVGSGSAIFATMMLGGKGAIPATGNIATKFCSEIYNAFLAGKIEKSRDLQYKVLPLDNFLTGPSGYGVPGMKAGMNIMNLPAGIPRRPLLPLPDEIKKELRAILQSLGLIQIH